MATNKTQANSTSVSKFIQSVTPESKREDAKILLELFGEITQEKPVMWGSSIIGFGRYHYTYESGREGDFMMAGFSPRKQNIAVYIMPGFSRYQSLLDKIGAHKVGKSCLYVTRLDKVHLPTLKKLIERSYKDMCKKYS